MDRKEFIQKLKKDKWFDNPDKLIEYRLPVIQYYLTHMTNSAVMISGRTFYSNLTTIKYDPETDFTLVNQTWDKLKEIFKDELK